MTQDGSHFSPQDKQFSSTLTAYVGVKDKSGSELNASEKFYIYDPKTGNESSGTPAGQGGC